jgi:hypothetical protein
MSFSGAPASRTTLQSSLMYWAGFRISLALLALRLGLSGLLEIM